MAESNTAALGDAFPDTVWVRSPGHGNLRASYGAAGVPSADMPQMMQLAGISNPRIGPDLPGRFDGTPLDGCRWDVLRPGPDAAAGHRWQP